MRSPGSRSLVMVTMAVLLFLCVLSACFYVERTTCFDGAWQSWQMILRHAPHAEHHRYSTMITQVVPVLLLWLKAPLGMVLGAYSMSFIMVHVAVFFAIRRWLGDQKAAVALVIALVTAVGGTFYFGVSEVQQGIGAPILLWALMRRMLDAGDRQAVVRHGIGVLLCAVWASFYHMVFLLPVVHVVILEIIARRAWRKWLAWSMLIAVVGVFLLRNALIGMSAYEQERMVGTTEFLQLLSKLDTLASTRHLGEVHPLFPSIQLLIGITIVGGLLRLRWLSLLATVAWTAACVPLILIADRSVGSPYMFENLYPIIGIAWAVAAASIWVDPPKFQRPALGLLSIVLLAGCWQIWRARHVPTDKVEYAERMTTALRERGIHKAIISAHCVPWTYAQTHWTLPFETVIVSALHGPDSAVTVFAEEPMDKAGDCTYRPDRFLGPSWNFCMYGLDEVDTTYFRLPNGPYTFATAFPDGTTNENILDGATLTAPSGHLVMRSGPYDLIPVRICAGKGGPWRALMPHDLTVVRCELKKAGSDEVFSSEWTSLETDLPADASQMMAVKIQRPAVGGEYLAYLELLVNGRPTGIKDTLRVSTHSLGM